MKHHQTLHSIRSSLRIGTALAVVMLTAWTNGAFAQSTALVKIVPNETTISVGQTIEMAVQVENIANLYGIEMLITFNHNLLEVVDANPDKPGTQIRTGGFLRGGLEGVNTVTDGTIDYVMQQIAPNPPSNGSGTLVRIVFKGIGSGMADIRIEDLNLSDQASQGIGSAFHSAQITILPGSVDGLTPTPISPTPVPPTPTPVPLAPIPQPPTSAPPITAQSPGVNCTAVQGYHIVQRGETLYAIARAYATNPYAIVACNPTINPRRIHASNHLAIPYAPWTPPAGPTAARQFAPRLIPAPVPAPEPGCRAWHAVQPGETLTAIGLKYNVNIWDIARANRIYNLHLINSGQVLCIP